MRLAALQDAGVLAAILEATYLYGLWGDLLPLLALMEADMQAQLSLQAETLNDATLQEVIRLAHEQGLWLPALDLVLKMRAERRTSLSLLMGQQPPALLQDMLSHIARAERWPALFELLHSLPPSAQERLLADGLSAAHEKEMLAALLRCVHRDRLWPQALPLVQAMAPAQQALFARLPELAQADVLHALLQASYEHGLWARLLPLLSLMDEAAQVALAEAAESFSNTVLEEVIQLAHREGQWLPTLDLVLKMRPERRSAVCLLVGQQGALLLLDMLAHIGQAERWQALFGLLEEMPLEAQQHLLQQALELGVDYWSRLMAAAEATAAWDVALHSFARCNAELRASLRELMQELPGEQQSRIRQRADQLGLAELFA